MSDLGGCGPFGRDVCSIFRKHASTLNELSKDVWPFKKYVIRMVKKLSPILHVKYELYGIELKQ